MQIEYLQDLANNPVSYTGKRIRPISEAEITALEHLYNNGKPFPNALKELLYLAGDYCYVLDYGIDESQQETQEFVKETMDLFGGGKQISRPFYAIDVYNGNDQFLFVYLDEGEDPPVYEAIYYKPEPTWIHLINSKLSLFLSSRIRREQEGQNPF
jgi:hypothetical protein